MIAAVPKIAGRGAGLSGLKAAGTSSIPVMADSIDANSCHVGPSLMPSRPSRWLLDIKRLRALKALKSHWTTST